MGLLPYHQPRVKSGFTLIEVLIALLILGIALAAIIKATDDEARNLTKLKSFTLAHWIAEDVITNIQLGQLPTPTADTPLEGTTKFKFFNNNWFYIAIINDTKQKQTKLLTVAVKPNQDAPVTVTEYGFLQEKEKSTLE